MAVEGLLNFQSITETEMRQWVEANPGGINDKDSKGNTPLFVAAVHHASVQLVLWLVKEKGAGVNVQNNYQGVRALHKVKSLDVLNTLLALGADPRLSCNRREQPLTRHIEEVNDDIVARLLEDPRVRATMDDLTRGCGTILHFACRKRLTSNSTFYHLLQTGANPYMTTYLGDTPLVILRRRFPVRHAAAIALIEKALAEAGKTSLLVKARSLVLVTTSTAAVPSYLQGRVARNEPLPRVMLPPVTGGNKRAKNRRKFRSMLAFLLDMRGGPNGQGMIEDLFGEVLDFFSPSRDPLRPRAGAGPCRDESERLWPGRPWHPTKM